MHNGPKQIMTEIHSFYANLYDKDFCQQGGLSIDEFLKNVNNGLKFISSSQRVMFFLLYGD